MAVFRVEKTKDFTIMCNHHLRNTELSLKAKGLLSLMLSLPEDWDYTTKGLAHICKDGVDSITTALKRLTYRDPGANTIEVSGRIRSFERYARKHQVRYHIEKELGTDPPKWTVYFKANQADALTAAFKEYTQKDLARSTRPSLLSQLHKFKELAQALGRDRVKNKEHGGPER